MKKSLKIFLPILIAAILLLCAYLFFFVIRPDITAGFYVNRGDRKMEHGRYASAVSSYRTAYTLDGEDAEIAVKLSEAYAKTGNFTKAEYTLVSAKAKLPNELSLYIALSKIYVMQDKLLDAQKMLDQIGNSAIVAKLSAMRPAEPVCTPDSGFYSDYVTVTLTADDGVAVYYTTDGSYPTKENGAYSEPFQLPGGESTVLALAVSENGLVSTLASCNYTVSGVVEPITLTDPALDSYVRQTLQKSDTYQLLTSDLWQLQELNVPEEVQSLDDLRYFTGLRSLAITDDCDSDFSFLTAMDKLETLNLSGCSISADSLAQIGTVTTLKSLDLSSCGLSTVSSLQGLTALTSLNLYDNSIADLTPLTDMTEMTVLNLSRNAATSVVPLKGMTKLQELDASFNSISSADALAGCTQLVKLDLSSNKLSSVSFAASMSSLTHFAANKNSLTSISSLLSCKTLVRLELANNAITSIDGVQNLLQLSYLDFSHNSVETLPHFSASSQLSQFYASYNQLSDLSGLSGLSYLNYVDVDYNENVSDLSCLESCYALVQVNAFGTDVSDVRDLVEMDVIVNYDPSNLD